MTSLDSGRPRRRPVSPCWFAFVLLSPASLVAAEPPRNQVPYVTPELEKLRTLTRDHQLHISNLKSQVERLTRELDQVKAVQEKSQETVARLQLELSGERARVEALRNQVAALDREVNRPRGNRRELVGAWRVISVEEDGEKRPQAITRLVFMGSSVAFHQQESGRERVFTYRVDAEAEPKELDVFGGEFRPTLAIYRVINDRLTLCIDQHSTGRPSEFQSKVDSGTALWTLEREPRAKKEGAGATHQSVPTTTALAQEASR